jgi:hypothetical protein
MEIVDATKKRHIDYGFMEPTSTRKATDQGRPVFIPCKISTTPAILSASPFPSAIVRKGRKDRTRSNTLATCTPISLPRGMLNTRMNSVRAARSPQDVGNGRPPRGSRKMADQGGIRNASIEAYMICPPRRPGRQGEIRLRQSRRGQARQAIDKGKGVLACG